MKTNSITLLGDVPSKKNAKQIVYVRGKPIIVSSSRFKLWNNTSLKAVKAFYRGLNVKNVESIIMTIFPSSKRKADLSNKFESVADLLVDAGIIEDDNWFIVPKVVLLFGGVDKQNPRVCIDIINN